MRSDSSAAPAAHNLHPLTKSVPLRIAGEILHVGRSKLYELLGAGKLAAVKDGPRVMVLIDSIKAYQATLPVASFAPPRPHRFGSLANLHGRGRRRRKARA
jgi:hypothetical protein